MIKEAHKMDILNENWKAIKETVRKEYNLSDISYHTWIEPLQIHSVDLDTVNIMIPSDQAHALNYITSKYKSYFQVTITELFEYPFEVAFVLEKDIQHSVSESSFSYSLSDKDDKKNSAFRSNLNPKYKFDTFVVGSNNKFAHSASLAVAESPGEVYNPLYLYGGAGLGKTHLMHSIGHFILEQNPNKNVLYATSEEFTNEVIESIRSGNAAAMTKLREKYRTVDVLMIDDVQFIIGKESTQEEFFHTFNVLHSARKQIILSSDKPPKEMETLDERFRSRFEWGLIADIQAPDYETRMAILKKNADLYHRAIDEKIIDYIASNIKSNIRELEGAFNKIFAYAKLNKVQLTLEMAKEALKDVIYPHKPKEITSSFIISVVAEQFGVKPEEITSKKRNTEYVIPRQVVMYLCREYTNLPLKTIGQTLGKRDHTTVMHGVEKINDELQNNEELIHKIDMIRKKINPST
jgi:chromosomal replication initiator protein